MAKASPFFERGPFVQTEPAFTAGFLVTHIFDCGSLFHHWVNGKWICDTALTMKVSRQNCEGNAFFFVSFERRIELCRYGNGLNDNERVQFISIYESMLELWGCE